MSIGWSGVAWGVGAGMGGLTFGMRIWYDRYVSGSMLHLL